MDNVRLGFMNVTGPDAIPDERRVREIIQEEVREIVREEIAKVRRMLLEVGKSQNE